MYQELKDWLSIQALVHEIQYQLYKILPGDKTQSYFQVRYSNGFLLHRVYKHTRKEYSFRCGYTFLVGGAPLKEITLLILVKTNKAVHFRKILIPIQKYTTQDYNDFELYFWNALEDIFHEIIQ